MTYFTQDDHKTVLLVRSHPGDTTLERVSKRMDDLHRKLHSRIKQYSLMLTPFPESGLSNHTNTSPLPTDTMSLVYSRTPAEALTVERIIGRETQHHTETQIFLHPTLEVRLLPTHLAVELVVAPDARYDQQNFVGKLSLHQHRDTFFRVLSRLGSGFMLGFWAGNHLDSMHLNTEQLPPARILFEYLDTFAAGRDYFRVGRWYDPQDAALGEDLIVNEIFQRLRQLYTVYDFLRWTSDNNFHSFYQKSRSKATD
ncbi:MAG: hypothetical protein OHK0046_20870 [Anaerolineae bacterium]